MAEALKTFREGEDILASETNENNQYLLSKLSDNAAQVQSYVEGEIATIKSNVASVQATLQNNIDLVKELVRQAYNDLMPDWSNKVIRENNREYTAEKFGYIVANGSPQGNNSLNCYINGEKVINLSFHGLSGASYSEGFTLPVAKNDVYKIIGANTLCYFVPCKGEFEEEV